VEENIVKILKVTKTDIEKVLDEIRTDNFLELPKEAIADMFEMSMLVMQHQNNILLGMFKDE